ncbi:MAG: DUF5615 family PIN-like protein [Candidatus Hydrogenedentes bacterium]|nr:DUF5615 family PIN-like protein [Candidatus Hydrogenedentota bacterium]
MKLLLDQNLSPRLTRLLSHQFPGILHVSEIGLDRASDLAVWEYARENDCTIVTKDADFSELGTIEGFPPRVIWIRRGNCSTSDIEALLKQNRDAIAMLIADPTAGVLVLM